MSGTKKLLSDLYLKIRLFLKVRKKFLKDATNVYRTKNYIVKQLIGLEYDSVEGANLCSYDTFYLRTKARDAEYENCFKARRCVNGKRLTTGLATRKYV